MVDCDADKVTKQGQGHGKVTQVTPKVMQTTPEMQETHSSC